MVAIPGAVEAEPPPMTDADAPASDDEAPQDAPHDASPPAAAAAPAAPAPAPEPAAHPADAGGRQRYGEAVVREVLNATFLSEEVLEPNVTPTASTDWPTEPPPPRDE